MPPSVVPAIVTTTNFSVLRGVARMSRNSAMSGMTGQMVASPTAHVKQIHVPRCDASSRQR
jgi:hypothetical protein